MGQHPQSRANTATSTKIAIDGEIYEPKYIECSADNGQRSVQTIAGKNVLVPDRNEYEIRLITDQQLDIAPESKMVIRGGRGGRFRTYEKIANVKQRPDINEQSGQTEWTTVVSALECTIQ